MRTFWRILLAAAALVAVAALGFVGWIVFGPGPTDFAGRDRVALSDYKLADPTGVPASLKDASLIDRGRYLIRAADCEACHTAIGGQPFAGGRAFVLPFGTIYSTNITPDKDTGIGQYTDADFLAAVHRGVRRDGAPLYPAMPFASYTYLTDADALAIKAYLFSLEPINAPAIPNTFAFPFDQRWAMGVWAMMFNANRRFEPHANQSAEWNRGAYLVEALAHCGECHTPRNLFQALDNRSKFAGAVTGGWSAYNITGDPKSGVGALDRGGARALSRHGTCRGARHGGRADGRSGRPQPRASDGRRHCRHGRLSAHGSANRQSESPGAQTARRDRRARARSERPSARRADLCGSLRELSRMDGQEPDLGPGDDRGRALGQRPLRRQCGAGHPVRRRAHGRAKRGWRCRASATPILTPRSPPPPTMSRRGSAPRVRA